MSTERKDKKALTATTAAILTMASLFIFGVIAMPFNNIQTAFAQSGYASGPEPMRSIVVNNEDIDTIINQEPVPVVEPEQQEATQEFVDQDCKDITARNFQVGPEDPNGFDGDNDGVGCETTVSNVVVEPEAEEETVTKPTAETETQEQSLTSRIIVEVQSAKVVIQNGNNADGLVHIDNALGLLGQVETLNEVEETETQQPQAQPEVPSSTTTESEPLGNVLDPVQIFGATFQECLEHAFNLGFVMVGVVAEENENTEVVEAIEENPETVEQAMNETGTTEEIA